MTENIETATPVRLANSRTYIRILTMILPPLNSKPQDQEASNMCSNKKGGGKADLRPICSTSSIHLLFNPICSFSHHNFCCVGGAREGEEVVKRRGAS